MGIDARPQRTPDHVLHPVFSRLSIRFRLLLASTAVQIVLLSLLLFNSVRLMDDATTASLQTVLEQNAFMLHSVATAYGERGDYSVLQDTLGELLEESGEGLVYVRIASADGATMLAAGMPELTTIPPPDSDDEAGIAEALKRKLIHVRRPILLPGNEVGFLQFGVSAAALGAARQAILRQGAGIAGAEILLTFVLLSGIGYLLTRNFAALLTGSRAIAEGRLDHRLPETGNDELAQLSRDFNIMAGKLNDRIGELQDTAGRLHESEQRYALAMQGANDGLWDWDIENDSIYVAPRFCEICGLPPETASITREDFVRSAHPDDLSNYRRRLVEHLKGASPQFMVEHRIRCPDGTYRWVLMRGVALRDEHSGRSFRMAGSISDIHQRKLAEERLMRDALYDSLTGLTNRGLMLAHLKSALGQVRRRSDFRFAVMALKIERFRMVNDSLGHASGDNLLRITAERIRMVLREGDVASRLGGDQFAVLLNGVIDADDAHNLGGRLRDELGKPLTLVGQTVYPDVRIGIALSEDAQRDAEAMLRDADNALNQARRDGDHSIALFQADMHVRTMQSLQREAELREALQGKQLRVHFQPIVNLRDRKLKSLEALVRWEHPEQGLLSPFHFVPLAEQLDLVHALCMQVIDIVCAQIKDWKAEFGYAPPVSINLSARQFARPELASEIIATVQRNAIPPESLCFEVTESTLATPDGRATEILEELRRSGMPVFIDDFGTGYSALSYLHTMPCDVIKLDGSFVRSIAEDERLRAIVGRSIELAHDLGMTVVAECIETEQQAELLTALGCDFGQGYLYAKPLDASAIDLPAAIGESGIRDLT